MKNPNCPCSHKECIIYSDCDKCKATHPAPRKTYCKGRAAQKGFINFASKVDFLKKLYKIILVGTLKKILSEDEIHILNKKQNIDAINCETSCGKNKNIKQ
jgi:hypothetical protein